MKTIIVALVLVIVVAFVVVGLIKPKESTTPTDRFIGPTSEPYSNGPQGLPPQN